MLGSAKINEIQRLLADGRLSHRAIAQRVGVSRTVVAAIGKGSRDRRAADSEYNGIDECPRRRCPSCGYLVPMPCVYCRAKEYRRRSGFLA